MKKYLLIIPFILLAGIARASWFSDLFSPQPNIGASVFNSAQVGSSPQNGYYLRTNGTVSTWEAVTGGSSIVTSTNPLMASYFVSTSTTASVFPYASTSQLTATTLYLPDDSIEEADVNFITTCASTGKLYIDSGNLACGTDSTGSGGAGTISTSTSPTIGQLAYWTSKDAWPETLGSVGTSTLTAAYPLSGSFTYIGSGGTLTWAGLATTSQPASSNLLVSNGTNGVFGVGTSTLSASAPLTGSFVQVGSGGALGCTTAASGVAGCLSNTSFDTFNNKQATISANFPITLTGAAVGFNGLSTSTAAVSGNIPYFSGVNTFANIATTSETCTFPQVCAAHTVLTGGGAITWGGLTTSSAAVTSNLLYFSGANTLANVATTSETCTWPQICAAHAVLTGGGAITFGGLSTSTAAVIGGVPYFSGVNTFANLATTTLTGTYPVSITNSPVVFGASGAVISFPATSTLYGTGSYGNILMWNTQPTWTATSVLTRLPNLTDVGTIAVGTWQGTPVGTAYGGTGLSTGGLKANYIPYGNGASAFSTSSLLYFSSPSLVASYVTSTAISGTNFNYTYGSTTAISGTSVCIGTDCKTTWPTASVSGGTAGMLTSWFDATTLTATSSPTGAFFVATSTSRSILPYLTASFSSSTALTATNLFTTFASSTAISGVNLTLSGAALIPYGSSTSWTATNLFSTYASSTAYSGVNLNLSGIASSSWSSSTAISAVNANFKTASTTNASTTLLSVNSYMQPGFFTMVANVSSSTWGLGTTTRSLGPAMGNITVDGVYCETLAGTLAVSLYTASTRADYIDTASTTINYFTYTTNNSFTKGQSLLVDFGKAASSPTSITCRWKYYYTTNF